MPGCLEAEELPHVPPPGQGGRAGSLSSPSPAPTTQFTGAGAMMFAVVTELEGEEGEPPAGPKASWPPDIPLPPRGSTGAASPPNRPGR